MKIKTSNKWRNTIRIKSHLSEETSPKIITSLCNVIIRQLKRIKKKEEEGNLIDDHAWYVMDKLEESIDGFSFVLHIANGEIPESDWGEYEYKGGNEELNELFNECMKELYDMGDIRVRSIRGVVEKFIWVN